MKVIDNYLDQHHVKELNDLHIEYAKVHWIGAESNPNINAPAHREETSTTGSHSLAIRKVRNGRHATAKLRAKAAQRYTSQPSKRPYVCEPTKAAAAVGSGARHTWASAGKRPRRALSKSER